MRPIFWTTRERIGAGTAAHSLCASRAARQAATKVPASPSRTSATVSSVRAGLVEPKLPPGASSSVLPPTMEATVRAEGAVASRASVVRISMPPGVQVFIGFPTLATHPTPKLRASPPFSRIRVETRQITTQIGVLRMGILDKAIANSVPAIPRPVVRRISRRYIAGDTLAEAVATVRDLNKQGCVATMDLLGESTESKADAAQKLRDYKKVVDALEEHDLGSGISVKLTGLGLTLGEELCRANLGEIVSYAAEKDRFVRVDMEDSPYTGVTLDMVVDLHGRHENVGAVIQAYMRRSLEDVGRLTAAGVSVRLCKGIYDEPRRIAYKDFDTVRENYRLLLEELLRGGSYVGIATHDEFLVWHALRLIHQLEVPKSRYEFQMLLGVDEELRGILVGDRKSVV